MRHEDRYQGGLAGGRPAGPEAAGPQAEGLRRPAAAQPDSGRARPGLGALWLLLAPLACCGGPFLIAALAAAGALAWGGLGLGIAVLAAVAVVLVRRRHRNRACCEPAGGDWAGQAGVAAARRPAAR